MNGQTPVSYRNAVIAKESYWNKYEGNDFVRILQMLCISSDNKGEQKERRKILRSMIPTGLRGL
jgi:hypothetical protein